MGHENLLLGLFTKKNPAEMAGLYLNYLGGYALTFPFTFAITSSAIPDGAGE